MNQMFNFLEKEKSKDTSRLSTSLRERMLAFQIKIVK
jgi:hypothetical protein